MIKKEFSQEIIEGTISGWIFKKNVPFANEKTQFKAKEKPKKVDKEEKNISEKLLPEAKRQVSVYLVLEEIAKKENIAIDEHMSCKVMELLLREASWQENL